MEGADGEGGSGRRGESEFLVARSQFGACAAERVAYLLQDVVLAKRNGEEETVEAAGRARVSEDSTRRLRPRLTQS